MSWFGSQIMTESFTWFTLSLNKLARDETPCLLISMILSHCPVLMDSVWQSQQVIISVIMISRLMMRPLILWDIVFLGLFLWMLRFSLTGRKSLFSLRKLWTTIIEFENNSFTENLYFVIDTFHCKTISSLKVAFIKFFEVETSIISRLKFLTVSVNNKDQIFKNFLFIQAKSSKSERELVSFREYR